MVDFEVVDAEKALTFQVAVPNSGVDAFDIKKGHLNKN